MCDREPHPSTMEREDLEREVLALRVMASAIAAGLVAKEIDVTQEGLERLLTARATVNMIYGRG